MRSTAPTRRRLGAGLAVTLLALALAACGPSDDAPGVASADGGGAGGSGGSGGDAARGSGDPADSGRDFARCMREQGVDMADPTEDGVLDLDTGQDPSAAEDAIAACRDHMPSGGEIAGPSAEELDSMRAYAVCMREQGVEMDDPDPATGMAGIPQGPKDKVDAAAEVCQEHLSSLRAGAGETAGGDV